MKPDVKNFYCLFFSLATGITSLPAIAQDTLTLGQAVDRALQENYGIHVYSIAAESATLMNHPGEAGALPDVQGGVGDQFSSANIFQRFATGDEISSANASGNNVSAFVAVDWTLFDGFQVMARKDRLDELEKKQKNILQQEVENLTYQVATAYYSLVRIRQNLIQTNALIVLNEEREQLARNRYEAGLASRSEWLQAGVDLNTIRQQQPQWQMQESEWVIELNSLLALPLETPVVLPRQPALPEPDIASLRFSVLQNNSSLLQAISDKRLAEINRKEVDGRSMPTVVLSGAYNFSRTDNSAGFSLLNRSYGPVAAINLGIPLYQGGTIARQKQWASLQVESASWTAKEVEQQVMSEFEKSVARYEALKAMLSSQEETINLTKENLSIASERYKTGQSGLLELHQAQLSYEDAVKEFSDLHYERALAAERLFLLAGKPAGR